MPMLCSLNGQAPVDLPVPSCTWRHASTKQDGDATVFVPYTSAAYTSAHIDETRAFPVLLLSRLGRWDGICVKVTENGGGCVLACVSQSRLLSAVIAARDRTMENLTAGQIMQTVIAQTFASRAGPGLNPGTFAHLPPSISRFTLDGQTVAAAASTLQDMTGQEPQVTAGTFNWLPAVAPAYGTLLVEGDALTSPERTIEYDDTLTHLISRTDEGQEVAVRAAESAGVWQREQLFTTTTGTRVIRSIEAAAELDHQRLPHITLTVGLRDTGSHWATLREGMAVEALTPTAGFSGQAATYRVLSRTSTEGSPILGLELWHLPKPTHAGIAGFGAQIPAVVRPSDGDAYNQIHELIKIRAPFALQNPLGSLG
jgi:hypothetical protein